MKKNDVSDPKMCLPRKQCRNPWNRKCENIDIVVYIRHKNEQKPICKSCWKEIANNRYEWELE